MIFLDTHVIVWLYQADKNMFSERAQELLQEEMLAISPIVLLELEYLYESKKILHRGEQIVDELQKTIQLHIADDAWQKVCRFATTFDWTRDPFDRCIVAQAALHNEALLTKDANLLKKYEHAVW